MNCYLKYFVSRILPNSYDWPRIQNSISGQENEREGGERKTQREREIQWPPEELLKRARSKRT